MTGFIAAVAAYTAMSLPPPTIVTGPARFDLVNATVADASQLDGRLVRVTFTVGRPPDACFGVTVAAPSEPADGTERAAYLTGSPDVGEGDRITVVGVLRVRTHPPAVVNGVRVPGWCELRIDHGRLAARERPTE